mmetsp:Transcript_13012/g.17875  ORF Transcript_13012/g.17875 Transcript_13012/m.17875 type:complete len:294 (+) Transcript_13012:149-1030(+)
MSSKLVVVLGATGAQGGGVVDALLAQGFKVRGVTRDTSSASSQKLAAKGAEVVVGDVLKPETLKNAFQGAWAVFAVTNFWDPSQMGKEFEIGKGIADAAKEAGVTYLVWSSLANVQEISKDKWHVPHFTDKAKVADYITKIGLKGIFVGAAFYFQNFGSFFPPKKDDQGNLVFSMPYSETGLLTAFDVADVGPAVANILKNPEEWVGKFIPLYGTHAPVSEYIKTFTEVTGKPAKFNALPSNAFGAEMEHMFGWFGEFTYYGPNADYSLQKKVNPNAKTWADWLKSSGWANSL